MRSLRSPAATALAVLLLSSCSADTTTGAATTGATSPADVPSATEPPDPAAEVSETPTAAPAGPLLSVTVEGDQMTPNGRPIDLALGEPLTVEIDSDRAGSLHVHSKPEQYLEFAAGTSTRELVIQTPGVIDVEDDDTGDVVAQITAR